MENWFIHDSTNTDYYFAGSTNVTTEDRWNAMSFDEKCKLADEILSELTEAEIGELAMGGFGMWKNKPKEWFKEMGYDRYLEGDD